MEQEDNITHRVIIEKNAQTNVWLHTKQISKQMFINEQMFALHTKQISEQMFLKEQMFALLFML